MLPPILVNSDSLTGSGQLPKFAEESFRCSVCGDVQARRSAIRRKEGKTTELMHTLNGRWPPSWKRVRRRMVPFGSRRLWCPISAATESRRVERPVPVAMEWEQEVDGRYLS